MATEDFTFPTFTDALDSPPLWSLSPAASPDSSHSIKSKTSSRNQEEELENCFQIHKKANGNDSKRRKSFSWIERSSSPAAGGHKKSCEEDEDNKMDMLWEDFNEDLISSLKKRTTSDDNYININYMGCVHLKSSAAALQQQQQHSMNNKSTTSGFVMFIKVLKKLVFNKSHMNNIVSRDHCSVHPRQPHVNLSC